MPKEKEKQKEYIKLTGKVGTDIVRRRHKSEK